MSLRIAALLTLSAALSGCASYVNIPPDSNEDIAINAINAPPTPGVINAALDYVLAQHPAPQKPYGIRLPVEAGANTWHKVTADRDGAVPFSDLAPGQPVYDVRSIRVRGRDAWVDIVVPQAIDNRPLVEIRMEGHVSGWRVTSARRWAASVIRERESSGQYAPSAPSAPLTRTAQPTVESNAGNAEQRDSVIELEPSGDGERRPLTPIRPVKSDGGG